MDRRKFLTGCLCCAAVPLLTSCRQRKIVPNSPFLYEDKIPYNEPESPWLEHLEIHLTEHCNLGCKYCSHFSSIAEEHYYDLNNYEKEISRISELTHKHLGNFEILGGEPLLHPRINDLLKISRKYLPYTNIELLTNGLLLDSMPDSFWKTLRNEYINLTPTIYDIKINWDSVYKKLDKFGLYITDADFSKIIPIDKIKDNTVSYFYKINIDPEGKQDGSINCPYRCCVQLFEGKIYTCFAISNIRHFNKKFGYNIPVVESDYIDIFQVKSLQEIFDFLEKKEVHFCKYCAGTCATGEEWKTLKEHSADEWLYNAEFFEKHPRTDL